MHLAAPVSLTRPALQFEHGFPSPGDAVPALQLVHCRPSKACPAGQMLQDNSPVRSVNVCSGHDRHREALGLSV